MEFKGLRWAGNIYQKFEAMCLGVEEVMYEDSVKYMENQVQKVGVSMKKFYSEVMQDLLPPSSVDPVKVAAGDLPLNPYVHSDFNNKLKPFKLDNHKQVENKTAEDELIYNVTSGKKSSHDDVKLNSQLHPRNLIQNKCSELYPVKNKKVGVNKRPIGIKRISQNRCPPKISRPVTSLSGDSTSRLECDMGNTCMVDSDLTKATSSLDFSIRDELKEALNGNTPPSMGSDKIVAFRKDECELNSLASDKISSAESASKMKDGPAPASFPSNKILSAESVRNKNDDSMCSSSRQGLPAESIGASSKEDSCEGESVDDIINSDEALVASASVKDSPCGRPDSKFISDTRHDESACEGVTMSCEDNFDMEVIDNEEVAELRLEIFGKSTMDGSCVLVEENELHSVSPGTLKNKSYNKKIREAFSSKLKSSKKHDQHKDVPGKINGDGILACAVDSNPQESQPFDSFESDWELL